MSANRNPTPSSENSLCSLTCNISAALGQQDHILLSAIVNASADAILSKTLDGIITTWNPAAERMFGYTAEEIIGKPKTILFPPERLHEEEILLDRLKRGIPTNHFETVRVRKDGTPIHVSVTISPMKDGDGHVIGASTIARDITERIEAEALRQSHNRITALIAAIPDVIFRVNREGICLDYFGSDKAHSLVKTQDAVGKRLCDFIPPHVGELIRSRIDAALATQEMQSLQYQVNVDGIARHRDARIVAQTQDVALIVVRDVTDSKTMEQALRESEERLTLAHQVAQLGSWEYDLATGKITLSPMLFRLLGLAPEQGDPDYATSLARYHPEDAALLDTSVQQAVAEGKDYALDPRRTAVGGQPARWFHAVGKVERNETGQAGRLFGTLMDITERKVIEEAARQSLESLNHAQAMAHVGSWLRDYRAGTMTWSEELFRLCGLEPGAITPSAEALFTYTHPLDRKRAEACMKQAMQSGQGVEIEVRLVGADGALRHVFLRAEILKDEAGQPIGSRGTLTDVTERVKALQEQTKFVSLIEHSSDFIAMASLDGMLLSMNPAGRALVGLERVEEVTSTMLPDFMPDEVWEWMRQEVLPLVMHEDRWEGECQLVHAATGKIHDMQASFFLIRNPISGEPMCLATVQRDITDQKWLDTQLQQTILLVQEQNVQMELQHQEVVSANAHLEAANRRLESLATTDGLTGAKNHRAFQERLGEEFKRTERTYQPFSVILLDVDRFKQYNDAYGHPEGDRVLKQVVQSLQKTARESDFVARYGGEEFIILLPDTAIEGAMEAAERFRTAIETEYWPLRQVTASFGVASLSEDIETAQQLIDLADKALYLSKEAGRNCVTHIGARSI